MADEVYTLRFTFVGDDLLLSKIPVLNSLRLRESWGVRASWGRLSSKNESFLFDFPQNANTYGNIPYVEGSVGLIILGLLRVEYVHRFTYRDLPNAALGMARLGVTICGRRPNQPNACPFCSRCLQRKRSEKLLRFPPTRFIQ